MDILLAAPRASILFVGFAQSRTDRTGDTRRGPYSPTPSQLSGLTIRFIQYSYDLLLLYSYLSIVNLCGSSAVYTTSRASI